MLGVFNIVHVLSLAAAVLVPAGAAWLWLNKRRNRSLRAPLLLIGVCLLAVAVKFLAMPPFVHWSRGRAMENAAPMITAIEAYRERNGRYPVSLLSVHGDYDPGVIGIRRYLYEPHGDSYNLVFEQPSEVMGTREFVIYNPRGEQNFSSHDADL